MNIKNATVVIPPSDNLEISPNLVVVNTFFVAFGVLTFLVAFSAGAKIIYEYLIIKVENHPDGTLFSQVISLGLLFLMAWVVSFISIQLLNNRIYPYLLLAMGFLVSIGITVVYGIGVVKCFRELDLGPLKYVLILIAGYSIMVAFYILTDIANLRIMVIPLLAVLVVHIFLIAVHYIFLEAKNTSFIFLDLEFIAILLILMRLLTVRRPYLPLQQAVRAVVNALPPAFKNRALPRPR